MPGLRRLLVLFPLWLGACGPVHLTRVVLPLQGNPVGEATAESCALSCRSSGRYERCLAACPGALVLEGKCTASDTPPVAICSTTEGPVVDRITADTPPTASEGDGGSGAGAAIGLISSLLSLATSSKSEKSRPSEPGTSAPAAPPPRVAEAAPARAPATPATPRVEREKRAHEPASPTRGDKSK